MDINEKNLAKLQRLFNLMDDDALTKEQFLSAFKNVIDHVKKIDDRNKELLDGLAETYKILSEKIKSSHEEKNSKIDEELSSALLEIKIKNETLRRDIEEKFEDSEEKTYKKIISEIKIPDIMDLAGLMPKLGERIRDGLEILRGPDRLNMSAIDGLEEELKKIKEQKSSQMIGGGFSKLALNGSFADLYTPTGDVDGLNAVFTLVNFPSPVSSLEVYKDGQLMDINDDFTLSGKTITFSEAPLSGTKIKVKHRL